MPETTTIVVRPRYSNERSSVTAESDGLIAVHPAIEHRTAAPNQFRWIVTHVPSGIAFHTVNMQKPMADAFASELRALPHGEDWQFTDTPIPGSFRAAAEPIARRYKAMAEAAQEAADAEAFMQNARPDAIADLTVVRDQLNRALDALQDSTEFDAELRDYLIDLRESVTDMDLPYDVVRDRNAEAVA